MKKKVRPAVIINIAGCLIAAALLFYLTRMVMGAGVFRVRDIISAEKNTGNFSYLLGKNIFDIDLRRESARLSVHYPQYKKVRLIRIIPDQIFVDFLKREPLARVKLHRDYFVDEEKAFFELPAPAAVFELPVIYGLDKKIFALKTGKSYNIPELAGALEAIKGIKGDKALDNFKVRRIDLKPGTDMVIFGQLFYPASGGRRAGGNIQLFSVLEIRMPRDDIKLKIGMLSSIFIQGRESLKDIKYIDLRFKEPVLKFKNAKK